MEFIAEAVSPNRAVVSFSAGKDSSVIAHACAKVYPDIPIWIIDPGCPYHWLESERDQWAHYARAQGWNYRAIPWGKAYDFYFEPDSAAAHRQKVHKDYLIDFKAMADADGRDQVVLGLRKLESRARLYNAKRGQAYDHSDGVERILPILHWPSEWVWAYIAKHDIPHLTIYDHLGPNARNGLIGRSGEERGRLEYLKRYYPEVFDHLTNITNQK